jgi:endoglycosylceramidase
MTKQTRSTLLLTACIAVLLQLSACRSGGVDLLNTEIDTRSDGIHYLTDEQGRSLILHGVNVSNNAKWDPLRVGDINPAMVQRFSREWGFNAVRVLIFWDAIEPAKNSYDEAYLDLVEERLDWYAQENISVVLDMHQDVYSSVFCCDGAPEWAVRDDSIPYVEQEVWWKNYEEAAVQRAFDNFWDHDGPHADLQEQYTKAWLKVIDRFKDHPAVLGYDLINEPNEGSYSTLFFESQVLTGFYNRLIANIRTIDQDNWIFYEPRGGLVVAGLPSGLKKLNDTREGSPRLAYIPHLYEPTLSTNVPYLGLKTFIKAWKESRESEMLEYGAPVLIGEMGEDETKFGFMAYLEDMFTITQPMTSGWFLWSYDAGNWGLLNENGSENKKLDLLVQPYPQKIAGEALHVNYEFKTRILTLRYKTRAGITGNTEIFIPDERVYADGFSINVLPQSITWHWDSGKKMLSIDSNQSGLQENTAIQVKVIPF